MAKANGKLRAVPSQVGAHSLSKPEQHELREHDGHIAQLKIELANMDLQVAALEGRRVELRGAIVAAGQRYQEAIRRIARQKGIDVERGVHFDAHNMTLSSGSSPPLSLGAGSDGSTRRAPAPGEEKG